VGGTLQPLSARRHQLNDDVGFGGIERFSDRFGELIAELIHFRDDVSYHESGVIVGHLEQFVVIGFVGRDDGESQTT
jgi:hypothetical protein